MRQGLPIAEQYRQCAQRVRVVGNLNHDEDVKRTLNGIVTMHTRERLMAIEPRSTGLLATTLRMRDEVVNSAEALDAIPHGKPDKPMIDIARRIIEQQEGLFDPDEFKDRYEDALRSLIDEKTKGHKITRAPEPKDVGNVVDLMEALKRSIRGDGKRPKVAASASKAPKRKAAAVPP